MTHARHCGRRACDWPRRSPSCGFLHPGNPDVFPTSVAVERALSPKVRPQRRKWLKFDEIVVEAGRDLPDKRVDFADLTREFLNGIGVKWVKYVKWGPGDCAGGRRESVALFNPFNLNAI